MLINIYSFFLTDYKEIPFEVDIPNELNSASLLVSCTVQSDPKLQFFLF